MSWTSQSFPDGEEMTLILGAHLLKRIWLVCDTRTTYADGSHEDDLLKIATLNKRISIVAAGGAGSAAYILRRIRAKTNEDTTITELKALIRDRITDYMRDYVNETGRYDSNAFIIAGFDPTLPKKVAAGRAGDIMSLGPRLAGEGVRTEQSIDPELLKALTAALSKGREVSNSYSLELGYPHSELLSLTVSPKTLSFDFQKVRLFDSVLFHTAQDRIDISLPDKVIYDLEFRNRSGASWEQQMTDETLHLYAFVQDAIQTNNLETVGGVICPWMVSPDGTIFAAGEFGEVRPDGSTVMTKLGVDGDKFTYRLPTGDEGIFRLVEGVRTPSGMEL